MAPDLYMGRGGCRCTLGFAPWATPGHGTQSTAHSSSRHLTLCTDGGVAARGPQASARVWAAAGPPHTWTSRLGYNSPLTQPGSRGHSSTEPCASPCSYVLSLLDCVPPLLIAEPLTTVDPSLGKLGPPPPPPTQTVRGSPINQAIGIDQLVTTAWHIWTSFWSLTLVCAQFLSLAQDRKIPGLGTRKWISCSGVFKKEKGDTTIS